MCMVALVLCSMGTRAFDFDGINLNAPYVHVVKEIAKRGYYYDEARNCLKGNCQGTEIYLSINYIDVSKQGMIGQLFVEIPMEGTNQALTNVSTLLNVVYHQVAHDENSVTYAVDKDGTQLVITQKGTSVMLTYNTPYYKVKKHK